MQCDPVRTCVLPVSTYSTSGIPVVKPSQNPSTHNSRISKYPSPSPTQTHSCICLGRSALALGTQCANYLSWGFAGALLIQPKIKQHSSGDSNMVHSHPRKDGRSLALAVHARPFLTGKPYHCWVRTSRAGCTMTDAPFWPQHLTHIIKRTEQHLHYQLLVHTTPRVSLCNHAGAAGTNQTAHPCDTWTY